ncbi:MAG: PPK2 family polyphosphate kinase [Arcanobacterium sp.]|nr:PPK2 family polyphosphate kinase [Arcanobacterium sp.]
MSDILKVNRQNFSLAQIDPESNPGFAGKKLDGQATLKNREVELAELQERLYAASKGGAQNSVLLIVQGMDTSGKGGIMRHVVGQVDPQGVKIKAFKAPTETEKKEHFLARIERELPGPGIIGVFDRSHYEDVLIHRVHNWADPETLNRRYEEIREFEAKLLDRDITPIKVMLHISPEEQKTRLLERLDSPEKHWKFNPGDIDERAHWKKYLEAYELAIKETSTDAAPWYVIPANKKWFARLAVQDILIQTLRSINPQWPTADFDVEHERNRLLKQGEL